MLIIWKTSKIINLSCKTYNTIYLKENLFDLISLTCEQFHFLKKVETELSFQVTLKGGILCYSGLEEKNMEFVHQ